jgi:phosphoribosylanthranilate isomerase
MASAMTTLSRFPLHAAGVIDAGEAELLIDCGFDCLGFPLVLDRHAEDLSTSDAAAIVAKFSGRARFFLITYLREPDEIRRLCRNLGVDMVQLHGEIAPAQLKALRDGHAQLRIIKSLIVRADNFDGLAQQVKRFAPLVDAFITDTFDPATGASGATGKTHDWRISAKLVELSPKPVILAGGLNAGNVAEAIAQVSPAGVDVHTGIEGADGRKSRDSAARFAAEARAAFANLS